MKSDTRTVLNTSLSVVSSYSSSSLDVGDLYELAIDMSVTQVVFVAVNDSVSFNLSRIGADGNLYFLKGILELDETTLGIGTHNFSPADTFSINVGAGLPTNVSFGDQIQVDLVVSSGCSLTTTLSIKGKG
ncbi:MAG TPA: hypothetical protein VF974_01000 [Patescibacteria group bacterium]